VPSTDRLRRLENQVRRELPADQSSRCQLAVPAPQGGQQLGAVPRSLFVRARHTWDLDKIDQVSDDLGRVLVEVAEQPFTPDGFRNDHSDISSWCLEIAAKSEVRTDFGRLLCAKLVWRVARPAAERGHASAASRLDLGEPVSAIEQPPRADGRSAWHDRPAGSAEVDAGRCRNGHDCGVPADVAFPCTSLSGRRTVVAPRTLCTEATVSVAPGSFFRGGDHDHSNPARRPPATRPRATDS
jgi:hypothetical protein